MRPSAEPTNARLPTTTGEPRVWDNVVGQYWSDAMRSLCDDGLVVADVKSSCRPSGIESDQVFKVALAADGDVVLEDAGGSKDAASSVPDAS